MDPILFQTEILDKLQNTIPLVPNNNLAKNIESEVGGNIHEEEKKENYNQISLNSLEKVVEDSSLNRRILECTTIEERKRFLLTKKAKHLNRKGNLNEKEMKVFLIKNIIFFDFRF